jgi:hypothetical protein
MSLFALSGLNFFANFLSVSVCVFVCVCVCVCVRERERERERERDLAVQTGDKKRELCLYSSCAVYNRVSFFLLGGGINCFISY